MLEPKAGSAARNEPVRKRSRRWAALGVLLSAAIVGAALVLVFVLWTGIGAPFDGTLGRERLPWSSADLAPLPAPPGDAQLAAEALRLRPDELRSSFGTWPMMLWATVLALVAGAAWCTWWFERRSAALGERTRHAAGALAAPVLYLAGGLWLSRAAAHHALEGDFGPPDFSAWRLVPGFVAPALALFLAALGASLAGLWSIARAWPSAIRSDLRGARRKGLVFAACSGVLSLWALMWIDHVFLAPGHAQPRVGAPEIDLPVALHAQHGKWMPEENPLRLELWRAGGEIRCALTLSRTPREERAGLARQVGSGPLGEEG